MRARGAERRYRRARARRPDRDGEPGPSPGKHTLTQLLAPTQRSASPTPIGVGSLGDDLDRFAAQSDGQVADDIAHDAQHHDEAADLYARGRAAYEAGRFVEAGRLFEQAAAANRENRDDALYNAALSYGRASRAAGGQRGEASRPTGQPSDRDRAILGETPAQSASAIVDRETARADFAQGQQDYRAGNDERAAQRFEDSAARAPEATADLQYDAGMAHFRSGNYEAAVQSFRSALLGAGPRTPAAPVRDGAGRGGADRGPDALPVARDGATRGGANAAPRRDGATGRGALGTIGTGQLGGSTRTGASNGEHAASGSADASGEQATGPGSDVGGIRVHTAAPAPGGGHDRRTIGVGEHVAFSAQGSGTWTASAGQPTTASGGTFRWVAPSRPGAITISFAGARRGRQQARQQDQQQQGQQQGQQGQRPQDGQGQSSITMNVIAPSSVTFTKTGDLDGQYHGAGAGMELRYRIGPSNVSWGAIEVKEIRTGSAANAVGVQGYFAEHFTPENLRHDAAEAWENIEDNSEPASGRGDTAAIEPGANLPEPWTNGQYGWVIPWHYRTQGDRSAEGRPFTTVLQNFRIEGPSGRVTVTKGSASHSRTPPPGIVEPRREQERRPIEEPVRQLDYGAISAPAR